MNGFRVGIWAHRVCRRERAVGGLFLLGLYLCCMTSLSSCTMRSPVRSSILFIAVEGLNFHRSECAEDSTVRSPILKLSWFCGEAIRYTHAYSPTTATQGVLASIFTGVEPHSHGLRHNGPVGLSGSWTTLAEVALEAGYRTFFFSGGPPVFRKSGLGQGFEFFDDHFAPSLERPFRDATTAVSLFDEWLTEINGQAFFATLFFADTLFPDYPTFTKDKIARERSVQGQLESIQDALETLATKLKNRGLWNQLYVVLFGTNGADATDRALALNPFNLTSATTQVTLLIKPSRPQKDQATQWSIDRNVGLVDLYTTAMEWLGTKSQSSLSLSLNQSLRTPEVNWPENRVILVESAWPLWRGLGGVRWSVRKGPYLLLFDEPMKLYNTLIDRFESSPVPQTDPIWRFVERDLAPAKKAFQNVEWLAPNWPALEKVKLGQRLWSAGGLTDDNLQRLAQEFAASKDPQLGQWLALAFFELGKWEALANLGKKINNPIWQAVGGAKFGRSENSLVQSTACGQFFLPSAHEERGRTNGGEKGPTGNRFDLGLSAGSDSNAEQVCDDDLLLAIVDWVSERDQDKRERRLLRILPMYHRAQINRWLGKRNYAAGLVWDTPTKWPEGPLLADLYLSLPGHQGYLAILKKRLLNKDSGFDLSAPFEL